MIGPRKFVFDKNKSIEVEKGYVVDNYISDDDDIGYSMVRTHLDGAHPFMKNVKSNRTYYIIDGFAKFYFEDSNIEISSGEMISIPANTKYAFKGKFDAILVDHPAFRVVDDIIFDEYINE